MPSAKRVPQVTVLGSLNMDLVSYVPHHPLPGETMSASRFATNPGGKGANQAIACAKLSRARGDWASRGCDLPEAAHVGMIGAIGDDLNGRALINNLAAHGVDVENVRLRKDSQTGVAIVIVDQPTGQNRIILSPAANSSLLPSEVERSLPGPLPDLLIMQLEVPLSTVLRALETAREADVPVLLNPAPAVPLPDKAYRDLAHLVVNETEAATLAGVAESELESESGLQAVAKAFLSRGVETVIITLGGRGVFYANKNGKSGHVPAENTKVVDTTAAGDTFIGSYALEFVMAKARNVDFDIAGAVVKANKAAATTVARLGAQSSIPWRDEL